MQREYLNSILRELRDQQVRYAPRDRKVQQIERAEKLLGEIESDRTYTYEYLCYRITDYRPDAAPHRTVMGREARHDLRLFVEDVSDSADLRVDEMCEPVHTVDDLSRMFKVSTKTINRWREQGLVGRRLLFGGRKRVAFLRSSVDRFVATNSERIGRGERFTQLSGQERREIIVRARRLAHAGGYPTEISRRIAAHLNRSVETIRLALKQFDEQNPEVAIFSRPIEPLTSEAKARIYEQHLRGVPVDVLAERLGRTRTSVYRIVHELRARRILELPLDYIFNPEFLFAEAEPTILAPLACDETQDETQGRATKAPDGMPGYLAAMYDVALLSKAHEHHLFRKLNYLKFLASQLREDLDPARARTALMDRIESLYEQAVATKNEIVQANLRLVVSIAKRHVTPSDDLFSLVSDGNISLIRAVEKFDYARGNKFSTYASWAIMKNFARSIPDELKHRDRFRTSQEGEMFTAAEDDRQGQYEQEVAQQLRKQQVGAILSHLDEREQRIIICRFGLDHGDQPRTLHEVGTRMGVTKERVRQIEARALDKLRQAARLERIDLGE